MSGIRFLLLDDRMNLLGDYRRVFYFVKICCKDSLELTNIFKSELYYVSVI